MSSKWSSGFHTKAVYGFVVFPACDTCAVDFIFLDLTTSSIISYANVKVVQAVCDIHCLCSEDVLAAK